MGLKEKQALGKVLKGDVIRNRVEEVNELTGCKTTLQVEESSFASTETIDGIEIVCSAVATAFRKLCDKYENSEFEMVVKDITDKKLNMIRFVHQTPGSKKLTWENGVLTISCSFLKDVKFTEGFEGNNDGMEEVYSSDEIKNDIEKLLGNKEKQELARVLKGDVIKNYLDDIKENTGLDVTMRAEESSFLSDIRAVNGLSTHFGRLSTAFAKMCNKWENSEFEMVRDAIKEKGLTTIVLVNQLPGSKKISLNQGVLTLQCSFVKDSNYTEGFEGNNDGLEEDYQYFGMKEELESFL
jgi:peroxiredoxin